jgi:hypothetical protein
MRHGIRQATNDSKTIKIRIWQFLLPALHLSWVKAALRMTEISALHPDHLPYADFLA